jgi:hypothetical protein
VQKKGMHEGGAGMSDYQQFLQEQGQIDLFFQKGFKIRSVTENLNGTIVEFVKKIPDNEAEIIKTLQISTANARKYFSVKLIQQQHNQAGK